MHSQDSTTDCTRYILQVYVGALSLHYEALSVEASKQTTAEEIVSCIVERLGLTGNNYELAEVAGECKERRLSPHEKPVSVMLLWPMHSERDFHRFYLRETQSDVPWLDNYGLDPQILRDFLPFLLQPENREYPDLCQLPDLNESTLLENLRQRFEAGHIYTYVGSILIAVNPFKFHPIYNPKYVRLYQNQRIGPILPPHIFAIADNAYYCMLKEKKNQCVVISGESGSGKTESTNFLLHHLTALSQKGSHGSGVEQTILSAGPVLEAFGNAKTAHNNNSSRFGKFIQVNYRENGMVQGAVVQKYLLEKSRIVSQGSYERNYHVFYYLLSGATELEREALHLLPADKYHYLNAKNLTLENCDEKYEFSRLKQSMEMVGFSAEKQRRLFNVLSAVLLLGNVEFFPKKSTYHHDESVQVRNPDVVSIISELLKVKQETLMAALTSKRVKASGETLIMQYKLPEAIAARDALAKCLYGALFDWIVLQVNHALLNKDQTPHTGHSIGVLDIFGFEDFGPQNSFEQLCINYANEHLQYYFNLHVFKYEQKEYKREGIKWTDIEFMDNSGCLHLFESKPTGLLCILDDLCNFPGSTNEMLLQKFNSVQKDNQFYEKPQRKENAFIIKHYAGLVKYQVAEMREKNLDLMRQDIVSVLKNSSMAFVRELVGADPVAVFRWAIIRAFFRGYFAFRFAGIKHRRERNDQSVTKMSGKSRFRAPNENLLSKRLTMTNDLTSYMQRQLHQQPVHTVGTTASAKQSLSSNYAGGGGGGGVIGQHQQPQSTPRRSWSSFAFNHQSNNSLNNNNNNINSHSSSNKTSNHNNNDGKSHQLTNYEFSQSFGSNLSANNNIFSNSSGNDKNSRYHVREQTKFERSSQDVMARASQIVMKNKSFRPRERPKKGLKNLQSVKTLTAGQNLSNQTSVKTRKQPLTVTAQFQNSLIALMETLNQANPFFIRCIKSNPNKIPNQFDDATVTRQLRYTGMLETVRIRRAGYNVRLTYEEFIQLYRILLPKGLVSSQKDVRDFMNTMDLNKQHYQLGVTKIYMRESQKMRLDIKLHTRIIESIISIQRWFRGILQRRKFVILRTATVTLQSYWRMCLVQRQLKHKESAAICIQSIWRMYLARKWYLKLCNGVVVVQAHIRGKLARKKHCHLNNKKNVQKTRIKLRPTQSLPVHDNKSIDELCDAETLKYSITKPHYSLDIDVDHAQTNAVTSTAASRNNFYTNHHINYNTSAGASPVNYGHDTEHKNNIFVGVDPHTLLRLEAKTRDLLLDREMLRSSSGGVYGGYNSNAHKDQVNMNIQQQQRQQDVLDKPSVRSYDLDRAAKNYYDDAEALKRFDSTKTPVRRLDSGPSPIRRETRYDNSSGVSVTTTSSKNNNSVEIVVVPSPTGATTTTIIGGGNSTPQRNSTLVRGQNVQLGGYQSQAPTYQNVNYYQQQPSGAKLTNQQSSQSSQYSSQSSLNSNPTSPYYNAIAGDSLMSSASTTPTLLQHQQQVNEDFLQKGFYSPPKGKAAALLGTITEKQALVDKAATTKRRVKTNLSDEFIGSSANSQTSYNPNPNPFLVRRADLKPGVDTLKRRNSDPTNKIPLLEVNRGNDRYQSTTNINIAGHRLRKISRISKTDKCASCNESDSFVNEGYRCLDCKVLLHTKCIQNGGIKSIQCDTKRSKRLRKTAEKSLSHGGGTSGTGIYNSIGDSTPNSKCSGTREYTDSTDKIISDAKELQLMQDFITQKICKMDNDCDKSSEVDRVFKQALREFKDNLVAQYSVAHKQNSDVLNIKYRDLIANFVQVMETASGRKDDFPLTMGVNAFRGFMNEFMSSRDTEKPKTKRKKDKKRKVEEHTSYNGHTFQLTIINIATACEICQLFLLWPIERGLVCQNCRLTCHKKCYQKSGVCSKISSPSVQPHYESSTLSAPNSKLFGVPLTALCAAEVGNKIPSQVDQIIIKIEMHGLYAEGLYRKSGVSSKIKELKSKMSDVSMNESAPEVDYESYNVHVLANVLKSFLREMPEPLLTFDRYDDFLRAADLSDHTDRVQTLLSLIKKLPPAHHALLERLIFHLALVAQREQYNRMSASSLAIVFAPCVLRTNRYVPAQDSLNDIGRQTKCMETLITQKMLNVKSTLADIDTLDTAAHTATTRLSTLRSSKVFTPEEFTTSARSAANLESEAEEMLLEGHIQEIKKEKALLTSTLPSLARASSDDDLLSTDLDGEGGSLDDLSSGGKEQQYHHHPHGGSNDNMRDSVDSAVYSLGDNTSRRTIELSSSGASSNRDITTISNLPSGHTEDDYEMGHHHEPAAVSYNLRDQNIDYLPASNHQHRGQLQQQQHISQQSIDRDAFMKNLTKSGEMASQKYSGSQQNLVSNINIGDGPSPASKYGPLTHGSGSACELQRQKPIVMRSISTGYDNSSSLLLNASPSGSSTTTTKSGKTIGRGTTITDLLVGHNKDSKDSKNNNRKTTKRQNSVDDEPIMV